MSTLPYTPPPVFAEIDRTDTWGTCCSCHIRKPIGSLWTNTRNKGDLGQHFVGRFCEACLKAICECLREAL